MSPANSLKAVLSKADDHILKKKTVNLLCNENFNSEKFCIIDTGHNKKAKLYTPNKDDHVLLAEKLGKNAAKERALKKFFVGCNGNLAKSPEKVTTKSLRDYGGGVNGAIGMWSSGGLRENLMTKLYEFYLI